LTATGPLAAVIACAMQPDRRARFADAKSMAAAILRDLLATSSSAAEAMAERVRGGAAAATPMEDFDRLIIAALGCGGGPGYVSDNDDDDLETRRGAHSLAPLAPVANDFSEQISTLMRAPPPPTLDDEDDGFGEEATTEAMQFGRVQVRPGDSISEVVCTNPVAVDEPEVPSSLPLAIGSAPTVLAPAPPTLLQRWRFQLGGPAGIVAAIVAATVILLAVALAIAHAHHASPRPTGAASTGRPAAASSTAATTPAARPPTTTRSTHRHGTRTAKLASRSGR